MFVRIVLGLTFVSVLCGCPLTPGAGDDDDTGDDDDDEVIETGFPAPADDVTDRIGAEETLDIGAWNIKNFPCGNDSFSTTCRPNADVTPSLVADVITSMGLDLIAVEEIADEEAFAETAQRLPHHEAIVSSDEYGDGTYQKIAYLYDTRVLEAGADSLLFQGDVNFPRPALQVSFTHKETGLSFFAIAIHLKAGGSDEDFARRGGALTRLHAYMSNLVDGDGQDNIILLGDFNETLTDSDGLANFEPLRDAARYDIRTQTNAFADEVSFLPSGVILDHIVTTAALADEAASRSAFIPRIDGDIEDYRGRLSDHLPVTLTLDP
jgi:endonuclease/exonuclease/phosphatase family metal-dependent hydrolase